MSNKLAFVLTALIGALALAVVPACGGGDDGDNMTADANTGGGADANTGGTADAGSQATMGLGQLCGGPMNLTCPTTGATACLVSQQGAVGFCSLICAMPATWTYDAQAMLSGITGQDDSACQTAFTAGVGTAACLFAISGTGNLPTPPAQPEANMSYTTDMACGILCEQGTNACPEGLTCNGGACQP